MYNYISGIAGDKTKNAIIVECGGIGYEIFASPATINRVTIGENIKLYTYLNVKEDEMSLYGFTEKAEKTMFLHLISISGIGPKAALGVLGGVDLKELTVSIVTGNSSQLNKIKGIGKKTAERIIVELRDKIVCEYDETGVKPTVAAEKIVDDAAMYLIAMGMNKSEAVRKIESVFSADKSVEQLVVDALSVK